jgi:hypothetical protein
MPRRELCLQHLGYALGLGSALVSEKASESDVQALGREARTKGIAQNVRGQHTARHSRRLTSGGKAEFKVAHSLLSQATAGIR